jgi:hypothetical protein
MQQTYKDFDATELFCSHCKKSVPVKKRLLLILPDGEKYNYDCAFCGASIGDKMVTEKRNLKVTLC